MKIIKWGCLIYVGQSVGLMFIFGLSETLGSGVTGFILILLLLLLIIIFINKSPETTTQFFSRMITQFFPCKGPVPKLMEDSEQLTEPVFASDYFKDPMILRTTLRELGSSVLRLIDATLACPFPDPLS